MSEKTDNGTVALDLHLHINMEYLSKFLTFISSTNELLDYNHGHEGVNASHVINNDIWIVIFDYLRFHEFAQMSRICKQFECITDPDTTKNSRYYHKINEYWYKKSFVIWIEIETLTKNDNDIYDSNTKLKLHQKLVANEFNCSTFICWRDVFKHISKYLSDNYLWYNPSQIILEKGNLVIDFAPLMQHALKHDALEIFKVTLLHRIHYDYNNLKVEDRYHDYIYHGKKTDPDCNGDKDCETSYGDIFNVASKSKSKSKHKHAAELNEVIQNVLMQLNMAIKYLAVNIIKYLLSCPIVVTNININTNINYNRARARGGRYPIMSTAFETGNIQILSLLLNAGADINVKINRNVAYLTNNCDSDNPAASLRTWSVLFREKYTTWYWNNCNDDCDDKRKHYGMNDEDKLTVIKYLINNKWIDIRRKYCWLQLLVLSIVDDCIDIIKYLIETHRNVIDWNCFDHKV